MIRFLELSSLCLLLFSFSAESTSPEVSPLRVVNVMDDDIHLFSHPNSIYIINSHVDCKGAMINLPDGCTLKFGRYGKLTNGTVMGRNTRLVGMTQGSLCIHMKGTWVIKKIKDTFFDWNHLTDNQILDNITEMQSDFVNNVIYLTKPDYCIEMSEKHKIGLRLKSNTILKNSSIIRVQGNNLPQYSVISINGGNVAIRGGEIIGDVGSHLYKDGSTSEWGFGISLHKATDVTISGIKISKCTGDGIYVGGGVGKEVGDYSEASKNIKIKNVTCDDNRRQGISITYVDGMLIENSVFSNTGKTEYTSPGCGLDIEPNDKQGVRDVLIKKCRFLYNDIILNVSIGGYQTDGSKCNVERITFDNCVITGTLSIRTGSVVLRRCTMATLAIHLAKMPKEKVFINYCQIKDGSGISIRSVGMTSDSENLPVYSFKSCTLGTNKELTRAMFSTISHKGNEVANFIVDDCIIDLPSGTRNYGIVQDDNSCSFQFSNCKIHPNGRSIELKESRYINCRVIERRR